MRSLYLQKAEKSFSVTPLVSIQAPKRLNKMNNNAYSIKELADKSALYHEKINMTRTIEAKVMFEFDPQKDQHQLPTTEKEVISPPLEFSELTFNDQEARETYVLIFLVSIETATFLCHRPVAVTCHGQ